MHLTQVSLANICSDSSGGLDLIFFFTGSDYASPVPAFQTMSLRGAGREAVVED